MSKGKIKISQCMIVKNEEHNMEKALSWGRGLVSEQIVVDTGSTDQTMEIARRMGAKVYEFPWIDDFAAAKNYAISKARYEWIAFLDADEYLAEGDAGKVQNYIEMLHDTEAESLLTAWVNLNDEGKIESVGTQSRFFKKHLRYESRIHEYLVSKKNGRPRAADVTGDVTIYHRGYGAQASRRKKGRNLKLILLELEEHPNNYEMWGHLGLEYISVGNWEEAEKSLRKAVDLMPEETKGDYDVTTSITMLRLLNVLITVGKPEEAVLEVYRHAEENWPEEADYDYTMARYFVSHGDWHQAEKYLKKGLETVETYGTACKSMVLAGEIRKAYELLAICCHNNGNLTDAVRYTTALLKEDRYLMSTLVVMLKTFLKDPQTAAQGEAGARQVASLLGNNFYDFSSLKDRLFVLQAAMNADYRELTAVIRGLFTSEELAAVDQRPGS